MADGCGDFAFGPDAQGIGAGILGQDVERLGVGHAKALALADSVAPQALVGADAAAVGQHDGTRARERMAALFQKGPVVVAGHETDFPRLARQGRCQTEFGQGGGIVGLAASGQGKDHLAQGRPRDKAQEITLVAARVVAPVQGRAVAGLLQPGEMAGGQVGGATFVGRGQEQAEFHAPVAGGTGIGGQALGIGGDERLDDALAKGLGQVHCLEGHAEYGALGGDGRGQLLLDGVRWQEVGMQGDDVMAFPGEQAQGKQAIGAARNGYGQAHGASHVWGMWGMGG
jgi:hypothetical protein